LGRAATSAGSDRIFPSCVIIIIIIVIVVVVVVVCVSYDRNS
jgi:t-SNARE complex subunit (syntaxin)